MVTMAHGRSVEAEQYYTHARPEVLRLIPQGVRQVVDVGCGAGALGAAIKRAFPEAQVRGVELMPEQAAAAAKVLDAAVNADANAALPASWPQPDCLVFADVLEHLVDPWAALAAWRARCQPKAWAVISLPNVAHVSVLSDLKRGRFDYQDEGLLDRTHLRFFTRATACALVEQAGYEVVQLDRVISVRGPAVTRSLVNLWVRGQHRRNLLRERSWTDPGLTLLDEMTFQYLILARSA
jgi:SAM-dependent methyltransferase